jgi:myo-inositol-1(or 4)-monophosphatase
VSADLELAERAARAAGEVLLSSYGQVPVGLGSKTSVTDPVSDADREAERTIRDLLLGERPDDGMLGEEGSQSRSDSGRTWIVDPLDGTVNFLYGLRTWGVSIALEDAEGLAVGVVFDPVDRECFSAVRGEGAWMNGDPISVNGCDRLERAMVATGFSYVAEERAQQAQLLLELLPRIRDVRRAGAAALDLAYVAAGRVDAYYELGLNPWDHAAGALVAREAGAVLGGLPGHPFAEPMAIAAAPSVAEPFLAVVTELFERYGAG